MDTETIEAPAVPERPVRLPLSIKDRAAYTPDRYYREDGSLPDDAPVILVRPGSDFDRMRHERAVDDLGAFGIDFAKLKRCRLDAAEILLNGDAADMREAIEQHFTLQAKAFRDDLGPSDALEFLRLEGRIGEFTDAAAREYPELARMVSQLNYRLNMTALVACHLFAMGVTTAGDETYEHVVQLEHTPRGMLTDASLARIHPNDRLAVGQFAMSLMRVSRDQKKS